MDCAACGQPIAADEVTHTCKDCKEVYCSFCSANHIAPDDQCYDCKYNELEKIEREHYETRY